MVSAVFIMQHTRLLNILLEMANSAGVVLCIVGFLHQIHFQRKPGAYKSASFENEQAHILVKLILLSNASSLY